MHDKRSLIESRLARVLNDRLRPAIHRRIAGLDVAVWHAPGEPVPVAQALAAQLGAVAVGTLGAALGHQLVPADRDGPRRGPAPRGGGLDLGFTGEAPASRPRAWSTGRTAASRDCTRATVGAGRGAGVDVYVEAAANPSVAERPPTPLGDKVTAGPSRCTAWPRRALRPRRGEQLIDDLEVLGELMPSCPTQPRGAGRSCAPSSARWTARPAGRRRHRRRGPRRAGRRPGCARAEPAAHRISAVGHAHIDSAWLWPLRETCARWPAPSSNVTALIGRLPRASSSRCRRPSSTPGSRSTGPRCSRGSREQVAAGRFVPVGGMWVESDTNMPGGEALARQFVHGKRFFLDEFGDRDARRCGCRTPSATPPRCRSSSKLAGCDWFLTQKISWNQTNTFPHHTFWWEGIDGTRIFTHFPPVDTYNARPVRRASSPTPRATSRTRARPAARWCRSAAATAAAAPPARCWRGPAGCATWRARRGSRSSGPADFFAKAEAEYPDAAGVGRRAVPGAAPRPRYTSQAQDQAGQPAQRAPAARGRAVGGHGRGADRARLPVRASWTGSGRRCCCTSSTTSCPAPRSPGCTARPRRPTPAVARELERLIDAALAGARPATGDRRAGRSTPRPHAPRRASPALGRRRPRPTSRRIARR